MLLSAMHVDCFIQILKHFHDLLEVISPVQYAFPTLKKAVIIAMTFGTSTCSDSRAYLLFPQKNKHLPTFYHVTNLARRSSNSEYRKRPFL